MCFATSWHVRHVSSSTRAGWRPSMRCEGGRKRNKRRTRPRWGPGPKHRSLDRGRRWDETELGHLVELVEVDAGLRNLSVLDPEELDAVADDLLVGRRNCASWALERGGVRAFHQDLLDDPGAAGDLTADFHLSVRERLQPGCGVGSGVLGVGRLEPARGVELDVVGVQLIQRLLIVRVERGYETGSRVFGFGHCVSS